jgi:Aspartyl protease/Tetratricopeptide repeat
MYEIFVSLLLAGLCTAPPDAHGPGDAAFAAADFTGAASAYAATLASDPHNPAAELGMARIALYRNDLDEAERYARMLAADSPADQRATRLLRAIADRRDAGSDDRTAITGAEVAVPFERMDPLPAFEGLVNGKRATLIIDTGGPGLDLSPSFVKKLGIETAPAGEAVFAGGQRAAIRSGHVDSLVMGGASIRSLEIHVPPQMPPGVDGVVGTNVLYRFLSTIDYRNHRLVLRPKTASQAFEAGADSRGDIVLPMLLVPDHAIFARARINRAPEALFNVDTGGPGIGVDLTKGELAAAGIVPDASHPDTFLGGGGQTRSLPFTADVTLGQRTFRKLPGVYLPDGDRTAIFPFAVAGTLSQELFKCGALTFDFSAMKLVFDAATC